MRHSTALWRGLIGVVLTLAGLLAASPVHSQDVPEYRLKAAFLYNFVAFTEWPAELGSTLAVCVYGPDPFGLELEPLEGKPVGARQIEIRRGVAQSALKQCQVVFVTAPAIGHIHLLLDALRGLPVLIVAETPGALQQGAMLNMNLVQGRITFEANLAATRSARLNLSSKLLRLATEVLQ